MLSIPSPNPTKMNDWLDTIYNLVAVKNDEQALDLMFDRVNRLIAARRYKELDLVLEQIDLDRLNCSMMLGLLFATRPAKSGLWQRNRMLQDIEDRIVPRAKR